jgi:hypothetical protein
VLGGANDAHGSVSDGQGEALDVPQGVALIAVSRLRQSKAMMAAEALLSERERFEISKLAQPQSTQGDG